MQVSSLLSPERVRVGLAGGDKREVIEAMVQLLAGDPMVTDLDAVLQAVLEREEKQPTGVGKGLAIPHGKTPAVTGNIAALALTAVPVDFGSLDDQPARLVFLLLGTPDSKSDHIKILSRISLLAIRSDVRKRMLAARTDSELFQAVTEGEAALVEG